MRSIIELYLEMTPHQGGVAHVIDIPGCHFRGSDREEFLSRGASQVGRYLDWCEECGLEELGAKVRALLRARKRAVSASGPALVLRVAEELPGRAIWESGSPAVLFAKEREPLNDEDVRAHFRVVRLAYQEIAKRVSRLDRVELMHKADQSRRSLAETLNHLGNCVWWYCSRLSDELPEPGEECPSEGLPRIQHLIPFAEEWLLAFPAESRGEVVVPTRLPTNDPEEPWTHRKACRRQAEHMVEHLRGIIRDISEM